MHNYAFRNTNNLRFSDVSVNWGLLEPSFSNGAAYGDLDNDGDMDFVVNNINDEAFLYRNNSSEAAPDNRYLQVSFIGSSSNKNGLGAWVEIFYDNGKREMS